MKDCGTIRKIDELGRIVIPADMRGAFRLANERFHQNFGESEKAKRLHFKKSDLYSAKSEDQNINNGAEPVSSSVQPHCCTHFLFYKCNLRFSSLRMLSPSKRINAANEMMLPATQIREG